MQKSAKTFHEKLKKTDFEMFFHFLALINEEICFLAYWIVELEELKEWNVGLLCWQFGLWDRYLTFYSSFSPAEWKRCRTKRLKNGAFHFPLSVTHDFDGCN
jgi:hypothetical protein